MSRRTYDSENGPLEGLMLLEASAGTGKTYALERMVARLVGREADPLAIEEILVVTFTRRAAREMKGRIRRLLSERAAEAHRSDEERARYRRALSNFDKAPIFTIHGFCQTVLGTWPFESSAPFVQEVAPGGALEESEARAWIAGLGPDDIDREVFRAAYREAGSVGGLVDRIVASLTGDEFPPGAAVRPSEAEAAAFAAYADASADPDSDLSRISDALFGPDWSAEAVKEVISEGLGKTKRGDSLEAVLERLRACRGARGIAGLSEILYEKNAHLSDFLMAASELRSSSPGRLAGEAADLASAAGELLDEIAPYADASESLVKRYMRCSFHDLAKKEVSERVENLKDRSGGWGYADLIRRVADAVADPDSPLRPLLRRRFKAALIDEFQDTDPRQWNLFASVFGVPGRLLCLIGDPKQSIYGFRGTDLRAYAEARRSVPSGNLHRLGTNYRSRPAMVSLVNRIFAPVFGRSSDGSEPMGFEPVDSGRLENDELLWRDASPLTLLDVPGRKMADLRSAAAAAVASEIRALLDPRSGARWRRAEDGREEPVSPSDIAVLARSMDDEADILERLVRAGIPAQRIRSLSVLETPAAESAATLMEAFEKPHSAPLWRAVLLGGLFRLPPGLEERFEQAGRLDELVARGGEWRSLFRDGRAAEAFDDFFEFSRRMGTWAVEAGRPDLGEFLGRSREQRVLAAPGGLRAWNDWRHVVELLQGRQAAGTRDPGELAAWIREGMISGDPEGRDDAVRMESESPSVRVMTMHTAKGLEFPLVFLHGGLKGKVSAPSEKPYRFDDGGSLVVDRLRKKENREKDLAYGWEEEKRLWYVAFTRASTKLWLARPSGEAPATAVESLLAEAFPPKGGDSADGRGSSPGALVLPPHLALAPKAGIPFREELTSVLRTAAADPGSGISLAAGNLEPPPLLPEPPLPEPSAAPLPPDFPGGRDPATGSYTGLAKSLEGIRDASGGRPAEGEPVDRDVDPLTAAPIPAGGDSFARAPAPEGMEVPLPEDRGAVFGTLVHALFEECDFRLAAGSEADWFEDDAVDEFFESVARRHYPPDWYPSRSRPLKAMVRSALRCPVPGLGRLCDLEEGSRRAEVEFLMEVPRTAKLPVDDLDAVLSRGYLKGFIDLLVRTGGTWWVLDWKTNLPAGSMSIEAYDEAGCAALMEHHRYELQYELYLLALCRTLSSLRGSPVDWEREIGGAAYLFVRGTREEDSRGVHAGKPTRERMEILASAMGLEGVIS